MITIKRLRLEIQAYNSQRFQSNNLFGFDIPFSNGLNVIKGENTSGKSTIISCLFFSLCLEEMLGGKNSHTLDKSLTKEFEYQEEKYNISSSYVLVEIENKKGNIVTLRRSIKSSKEEQSFVRIFEGEISGIQDKSPITTLFIHRERNHISPISFYKWFANFLEFEIPPVLNVKGDFSPLYIQTIFPALFIEQTKGWSDFLASVPYFGIKDYKQRIIEFLLNLKALKNEVEKEKIEEEKKRIKKDWTIIANKVELLAKAHIGKVVELPENPDIDPSLINHVSLKFKRGLNQEEYFNIDQLISSLESKEKEIEDTPKTVKDAKPELLNLLENKREEYKEYNKSQDDFILEFDAQKHQIKVYQQHLKELNEEIEANKDIRYLKEKDPTINELETCPTCHQDIGNSLIRKGTEVEHKTIQANINYLKNQSKLLESSIRNLKTTLEEKAVIESYYKKEMAQLETEIKNIQKELHDPETMPSRSQIYKKIQIENEIQSLQVVKENFQNLKNKLYLLVEKYNDKKTEGENLTNNQIEDTIKLRSFESTFKDLLLKFGYKSNPIARISIQKTFPFKYFPVVTIGDNKQKIQLSSSASDFVRSIWAYTISLLKESENQIGILLFDEPSQHSMKSSSLQKLLTTLASLQDKQIIVAASTEKHNKTEDKVSYTLDELLSGLNCNTYSISDKAIEKLKSIYISSDKN